MRDMAGRPKFDAIVVGTGFGGAVTICRLAQTGLRVCVLERGRRYDLASLPDMPKPGQVFPEPRRWTWSGSHGLWDLRDLDGVTVVQSAAYGGGSLVYANVHLRPPRRVFDQNWPEDLHCRVELDPCYDLVGYMLDIKPIPDAWRHVGKVKVMYEAFRDTARGVAPGAPAPPPEPVRPEDANVFFPPLAINFPPAPTPAPAPDPPPPPEREDRLPRNRFGAHQGECQRCGACDFGCRYGAKNTLDRNYLAVAEACRDEHGARLVEVRTLCEALAISQDKTSGEYTVTYRNHLLDAAESVSAKYLFVCGGSVNTTELLLRSVDMHTGRIEGLLDVDLAQPLAPMQQVGQNYFVNADAIAGVFDVKRETFMSAGPVITTALVCGSDATPAVPAPTRSKDYQARSSFLIEDGGYPPPIARLLATFKSPLLLGRNQFDPSRLAPPALTAVEGLKAGTPDRYLSILDGVAAAYRNGDLPDVLPRQFAEARDELVARLTRVRDAELAGLVAEIRDLVILNSWVFQFLKKLHVDTDCRTLWEKAYELFVKLARIDDGDLVASALEATRGRYGTDVPRSILERAAATVLGEPYKINPTRSAFRQDKPAAPEPRHQAVLLAMGRDDVPATLSLNDDKTLTARFPTGGFPTLSEEERVMRGVADQLGGTLRSSPLWAYARQPVTAHSHGGCAIGKVTDAWGEVRDHKNLFINDGSLLPRPVGVNPSSTIAALAERNVCHFVQHVLKRDLPMAWRRHIVASREWAKHQQDVALEPPEAVPMQLHHAPVGFAFAEHMAGHMHPLARPEPIALPGPGDKRVPRAPFLRAEGDGRAAGVEASFALDATVSDIGAFLDDHDHMMTLSGTLRLGPGLVDATATTVQPTGKLSLLAEGSPGRRIMVYTLNFSHNHADWTLVGQKEIQDDPGFDAWLDASTLYVELCQGTITVDSLLHPAAAPPKTAPKPPPTAVARGILRLGLRDFAVNQLQNMHALGTEDPARTIWTLGSFGVFFVGAMQGAYAPEIERFLALFGRALWRSSTPAGKPDKGRGGDGDGHYRLPVRRDEELGILKILGGL